MQNNVSVQEASYDTKGVPIATPPVVVPPVTNDVATISSFTLTFDATINIVNILWTSTKKTSSVSYSVYRIGNTTAINTIMQAVMGTYPLL